MTAREFSEALQLLVDGEMEHEEFVEEIQGCVDVVDFRGAGLLTLDVGFVVRVGSQEFQVTVKRAR